MAYSDIQDKLGQQQMANSVLLAEKYSQGNLFPKGSEGNPYSKNPRAEGARKKRAYKKAQEEKKKLPSDADIQTKGNMQGQPSPEEVFGEDYQGGPTYLNTLLQIGGAVGGGIVPLIQQLLIRNPNAMASGFPYDFEGGVVTPRYFTPPRYRQQPFLHIRTKDITDEELFHFNNFIRSMGGGLDTVKRRTPLSIAKLPHTPPTEKMVVGNKLEDSPLRFRSDADRIRLMEDFAKYDRPRA